jgi:hypothetical protein
MQNLELTKDLDVNAWKKKTGGYCYFKDPKATSVCMMGADGRTVCNSGGYTDGASLIIDKSTPQNYASKTACSPRY